LAAGLAGFLILEPRPAAPVLIRPVAPLRDNAFQAEPACVLEHGATVGRLEVLDDLDAVLRTA
jgi:hypothetical protein